MSALQILSWYYYYYYY